MLEFFRRNLFFNSLLLFPYTILVRIHSLLNPIKPVYAEDVSPFMAWIYEVIPSPLYQNILSCFIVYFQAVYINRLVIKHRLNRELTLWPGLIYILLCSLLPQYTYLSAPLIANTFILLAFSSIYKIYKQPFAVKYIFNSGLFICTAAIIYPPYISFLIAGFIGLTIIRSFKSMEMLQYLSGILIPLYLYGTWTYYHSNFGEKMGALVNNKFGFPNDIVPTSTTDFIYLGCILLLILITLLSYSKNTMKKSIQAQKKINILYWLLFCSLIALSINDNLRYEHLLLLAFPMSILLSHNLLRIKNPLISELIHLGILIFIGLLHFGVLDKVIPLS